MMMGAKCQRQAGRRVIDGGIQCVAAKGGNLTGRVGYCGRVMKVGAERRAAGLLRSGFKPSLDPV